MIGYSIMMWFVTVILLVLSVSLIRGNISSVHGRVFNETDDKVGYAKEMGKPCLLICIGTFLSGIVAISINGCTAIIYALFPLAILVTVSIVWFVRIQIKYTKK